MNYTKDRNEGRTQVGIGCVTLSPIGDMQVISRPRLSKCATQTSRRLCEVVRLQIYQKLLTTPSNCGESTLQCDVPLTANGPSNKPTRCPPVV
ncbi:hypothetical protein EV363DRAFT_1395897 [Boletus edulis]|nr:hypothetical protein EV363DRAFT_1395897 [Boletus edulis]